MWSTRRTASGQILTEDAIAYSDSTLGLLFVLGVCLLIPGCSNKSPKKTQGPSDSQKPVKERPPISIVVETANTLHKGIDPKKPAEPAKPLWYIAWKKANLTVVDGKQSGKMWDVTGKVYDKGVESSTFQAGEAEAKVRMGAKKDDLANVLSLTNGVKVLSKDKLTVLVAKNVEWLADKKVFKASGDVSVEGPKGVVGPTNELFVDSELDKIATSESYFQK